MENKIKSCGKCGVSIKNLTVTSEGREILSNINLEIHCGEFAALIGRNGAGKTTLLKAILGEIKHSGNIEFVDKCGCGINHAHVGYVPQHFYTDKSAAVSVCDFLSSFEAKLPVFLGNKALKPKIIKRLEKVGCAHLADRRLCELSGGELQRVMLAFALNPVPDLLILDEPISGVDQRGMDIFYNLVADLRKEHHIAVILVSHDFALVQKYATKAVLIDKEIMAQGTPTEVMASDAFLKTFGYPSKKEIEEENIKGENKNE